MIQRLYSENKYKHRYNELKHQLNLDKISSYILPKFKSINNYIILILIVDDKIVSSLIASIINNNVEINGLYTPNENRRKGYNTELHKYLYEFSLINNYAKIVSMPLQLSESKFIYEKLCYKSYKYDEFVYALSLNS